MKNIKKKISDRKFELTVIFLVLALIALLKILTVTMVSAEDTSTSSIPSLFYNDNGAFVYSMPGSNIYLPLEKIDGIYYIPRSMLILFEPNGLTMASMNNYTESFMILYNNNWISFSISGDKAKIGMDNYISCKVYNLNSDIYVPAQIIAENLGLIWEVREVKPGYNAGRISVKDAKRSFDELLEKYIPKPQPATPPPTEPPTPPPAITEPPTEPTTPSPVFVDPVIEPTTPIANNIIPTKPPEPTTTAEPTTVENTREIQNYLMFYDGSVSYDYYTENEDKNIETGTITINDRIAEALKLLDKNNIRGIFFLSRSEITENPDILRTIFSSGHELGIKFTDEEIKSGSNDLISVLESANNFIYSAVKHKTRFCIFEESAKHSGNVEYFENHKEEYESELAAHGYYLCKKTIDIFDLKDKNITDLNQMTDFIKQKRMNVFMFDLNGNYKNYLELSAKAAEAKFYINFSYINNANIETIKRQTNR